MHYLRRGKFYYLSIVVALICLHWPSKAWSLEAPSEDTEKSDTQIQLVEGTTPRSTVRQLLGMIADQDSDGIKQLFDTRAQPNLRGSGLGSLFESFPSLLNAYGTMVPIGLISNDEAGDRADDLNPNLEYIGKITIENRSIPLLLERIEATRGTKRWLLSHGTLVALSDLSDQHFESTIDQLLPNFLADKFWLGAPLGQWLVMPFIALISIILGALLSRSLGAFGSRYKQRNQTSRRGSVLLASSAPLGIVVAVMIFLLLERFLGISMVIRQNFGIVTVSLLWVAVFVFIWSLLDRLSQHGERVMRQNNRVSSLSLIIFFRASAKVILIILAVILVLDSNGVDVTTGLAALGIGGIALALGAQKTIENIVGSITLVVDQPFRLGDVCKIGERLGTVEHIGLRSTRLRTLDDTLVNIPNGLLSSERIENYSLRRKFLFRTTLNLVYGTSSKNMERLLVEMRAELKGHSFVSEESLRVRFVGYGATSLDVEIFAYILAHDYADFLQKQESILLRLGHIVESNGSGFAFPTQTIHINAANPLNID